VDTVIFQTIQELYRTSGLKEHLPDLGSEGKISHENVPGSRIPGNTQF
jgi:hypothetical protein